MPFRCRPSIFLLFFLMFGNRKIEAQAPVSVTLEVSPYQCVKGAAGVNISGLGTSDTLSINWSNGKKNVTSITELEAGDYQVVVNVKSKMDTTIQFTIDKLECPVYIENHFTPNGDSYNDTWNITNTEYYPKFEVYVFNKWGQQVHEQKGTFTPWDGKWNGVAALDGTYYYVFYFDGKDRNKLLKGDVSILR